jgi:hypothetical protein
MSSGEQIADDFGLRRAAYRSASALLKLALLVGIVAGGVWIFWRVGIERTLHEETVARNRLEAAGGVLIPGEVRYEVANFRPAAADDEGFAALAWFTTVREVEAPLARVTSDGLRHLAALRGLETLNLDGASLVDDRGLVHLKGLPRLRYLTLDGTSVGDEGLEHLRDVPALQYLSLAATRVTDAGLATIRELPQLRTLLLGYTKVTPEAAAELSRSCPHLKVGLKVLPKDRGRGILP